VAVSHDSHVVLTASSDLTVCVWHLKSPEKPICRLYIHVTATELQISKDKQTVIAIGASRNEPSRFMMFKLINLKKE